MKALKRGILGIFILSGAVFFTPVAFAKCKKPSGQVTLFLDFNNADAEIQTARKKVAERCGTLEVLTDVDSLQEKLKSLDKKKAKVSELIVSGHSSYSYFWGKNSKGKTAWMSQSSLLDLIRSSSALQDNLEAVYLWGCYTGTKNAVEKWVSSLPNVSVIFGHNGLAHLSGSGTGEDYLKSAMEMKESIVNQQSRESLLQAINKVVPNYGDGSQKTYMVSASIWARSCGEEGKRASFFSVDPKDTQLAQLEDFSQLDAVCEKRKEDYEDQFQKDLTAYWLGDKEILPIDHPDAKDPEKFPLRRKIYPWVNNNSICFKKGLIVNDRRIFWIQLGDPKNINPDHVLRLIYFNSIKEAFQKKYEKDLVSLRENLEKQGFDFPELSKVGQLSRKEILDSSKRLKKQDADKISYETRAQYLKIAHLIENLLVELNPACVNVSWLEGDGKVDDPGPECAEAPAPTKFVR